MADASTQTTPSANPKAANPRGGSGLFNLYRSFGKPGAPATGHGAGEGEPKAKAEAAAPVGGGVSRAAQLLAAQAKAAAPAPEPAVEADAPNPPVPEITVVLEDDDGGNEEATQTGEAAREQTHALARELRGDAQEATPTGPAGREGPSSVASPENRTARKRSAKSRSKRAPELAQIAQQLADVRQRKQLKRRVRGEDYEQVTMILDRELYLELDKRLADLSEASDGVKISRSMFVRALVRSFLADGQQVTLQGLFTPDPRSVEELDLVEAALVERLRAG